MPTSALLLSGLCDLEEMGSPLWAAGVSLYSGGDRLWGSWRAGQQNLLIQAARLDQGWAPEVRGASY